MTTTSRKYTLRSANPHAVDLNYVENDKPLWTTVAWSEAKDLLSDADYRRAVYLVEMAVPVRVSVEADISGNLYEVRCLLVGPDVTTRRFFRRDEGGTQSYASAKLEAEGVAERLGNRAILAL